MMLRRLSSVAGVVMVAWLAILVLATQAALLDAGHGAPPRMLEGAKSLFKVPKGEASLRLSCPVVQTEKEMLLIEWMKDNGQIWDSRYRMAKENRELRLKNVRFEDSGHYQCHATNGFGHKTFNFTVHVYDPNDGTFSVKDKIVLANSTSPPSWLVDSAEWSSSVKVTPGGRIELRCPARGNPIPEIRWYRNNILLNSDSPAHIASYIVHSADTSDSGMYRCVVENSLGAIDALFNVEVGDFSDGQKNSAEVIGPEPIIDVPYNISVKVGHTAQFQCKAKNSDNPLIKWLKEISDPEVVKKQDPNATIINTNGMHLLVLDRNQLESLSRDPEENIYANRLIIPAVTKSAEGRYICFVTTSLGHFVYKTAQLNVIDVDVVGKPLTTELMGVLAAVAIVICVCIVTSAIVFLRRNQEPSSPKMTKPPPPPRIPPPAAPLSLNRSFNGDFKSSPVILKNHMLMKGAVTLDRQYLKGNRGFDEMSHVYDCGSPTPYFGTPTKNHTAIYVPPSQNSYRTLEVGFGRTHPSLYSDDYTEQEPFMHGYRR